MTKAYYLIAIRYRYQRVCPLRIDLPVWLAFK